VKKLNHQARTASVVKPRVAESRQTQPAKASNIVDFFRQSPVVGTKLEIKRDRSPARDVNL